VTGERLPRGISPQAVATKDFAGVDNHWSCNAKRKAPSAFFRIHLSTLPFTMDYSGQADSASRRPSVTFHLSPFTFHRPPLLAPGFWLLTPSSDEQALIPTGPWAGRYYCFAASVAPDLTDTELCSCGTTLWPMGVPSLPLCECNWCQPRGSWRR